MEKKHELIDNAAEKRYEFDLGGDLAMIEYIKAQGFIVLTHTEVPEKYEGQGIGSELTRAVLEDLRAKKLPMIPLAQMQLDKRCPGRYNQAVMDFGALQCTPAQPGCADCPLASRCLALAAGTVAERPVKQTKTKVRDRWFNYLHVTCGDRTLLRRRGEGDIWQGLYEFPMIETDRAADFSELTASEEFRTVLGGVEWRLLRSVAMPKHQLSHQTLHAVFHRIEIFSPVDFPSVPTATLGDYAVPRLIDRYLDRQP